MTDDPEPPHTLVGLLRVRDHCTFIWRGTGVEGKRTVEVFANHCEACIAEVRRRGLELVYTPADRKPESP